MYDMVYEKSIYCDDCPLWREDVGCLHHGMGLYWDEDENERDILLCNTDTSNPELLAMYDLDPGMGWSF